MKKCCSNCFEDSIIKFLFEDLGEVNNCDYCGSRELKCIEVNHDEFKTIFSFFNEIYSVNPVRHSAKILDLLLIEWSIFSKESPKVLDLAQDIIKNTPGLDVDAYYTLQPKYEKFRQMFWDFSFEISYKRRFNLEMQDELKAIMEQLISNRSTLINRDAVFYRARIGGETDKYNNVIAPFKNIENLGMPPHKIASIGRANPRGIPYLYLADKYDTAVAEVRPWVGAKVSVGKFKINDPIRVVDLNSSIFHSFFDSIINFETRIGMNELGKWLSYELSKPIDPNESDLEYLPTQYLSEFIRNNAFAGIRYKSSMSTGNNMVLFNQYNIDFVESFLFNIEGIDYNMNPVSIL
ncbi:RES family NAD+ phosphorylase [Robertmurraya kyonggiensis]|uniref:RES domain-containing protein n=1 Tax=Robertmurraya kyonggiensis TaxID=1037680 RepID=A0A4V5P0I7_9BACI|nr:RES family NAD+ phosphorylase [Robertmurraya kyonggiensis]TKC14356.1 RES domain-containing protein [Robertmurraya kyonggiensis]